MKKKPLRNMLFTLITFILALGIPTAYVVYTQFYSMKHLPEGVQITSLASPNKKYSISIYRVEKNGAVPDVSIRGELTKVSTGDRKNIYWGSREVNADVEWKDSNHVFINDKVLDIRSDTYDWRRE
ncbi:DUF5412 family protein [Bacillus glycinifermentans]|uniref:DUF5412 family protein n=2 Tax=Bacillus glycinifermentans TaxID=1664069 RepID=UPI003D1F66F2